MPVLEFDITVPAPLAVVWAFHQDPSNLLRLSPPEQAVRLESADTPLREGSRLALALRAPFRGEVRWVARIVEHRPPHPVVFGEEARFVDELESGPFAAWRHEHDFEAVDSATTRVADRVAYRLPWGWAGWAGDVLMVRRQIKSAFRYRHRMLSQLWA